MIEGVKVRMGEREFEVPPLTLKDIKRLRPQLALLRGIDENATDIPDDQLDAAVDIVATAIRRNYPDVTNDTIEGLLDVRNIKIVIPAVMGASGIERRAQGEAVGPERSTGPASTDS